MELSRFFIDCKKTNFMGLPQSYPIFASVAEFLVLVYAWFKLRTILFCLGLLTLCKYVVVPQIPL